MTGYALGETKCIVYISTETFGFVQCSHRLKSSCVLNTSPNICKPARNKP